MKLPTLFHSSWNRWRRRKHYQRLGSPATSRRNMKITRFAGKSQRRVLKIKVVPKLRLKIFNSPLKFLARLKNAYISTMINLAGNVGYLNTENIFGNKRIPKSRKQVSGFYSGEEVENRLIYEIYKALMATREAN